MSITPIHSEANGELVDLLEEVLKDAKNGKIQSIAYVALFENGTTSHGTAWVKEIEMITQLLGEICLMRARIEYEVREAFPYEEDYD
jgi:hypothetical protein